MIDALLLIVFIIFLYLAFITWYFKSDVFISIKNKIKDYTQECNELNEHIESLKSSYDIIKHINYGKASLKDTSSYNMKRKHWKDEIHSEFVYKGSSTVVKNASNQPFKYICKYFSIKQNEETLEMFETVLNNFSAVEQGKFLLKNKKKHIIDSVANSINSWVLFFHPERVERELGFEDIDLSNLYFPVYSFQYVSAGGNSSSNVDVQFNISQLDDFVVYLSDLVKFKKSIQGQRSLMTSSLREKIKIRDDYTCKICNISTSDEKNLLLEIDHIIPLSKGGVTAEDNLQTLCWKCNRTKGSKLL